MRWWKRLTRKNREDDLDRELQSHLDLEAEDKQDSGLAADEARFAARRVLGNVALIKEDTRSTWRWAGLERLGQDLRYACRVMLRRPGFSVAAIVSLTLGIGANTAVFSILNALLLETLPVRQPESLIRLVEKTPDTPAPREVFAYPVYDQLRRGSRTLASVIAASASISRPAVILERGEERPAFVQMVSDNYFDVFGIRASAGRFFHETSPPSTEAIAVISDSYWRSRYGGDPSAIGATFRYYNREFTIAGIAPKEFRGTEIDFPTDIWVPVEQAYAPDSDLRLRGRLLRVMGRLDSAATLEGASAEANALLGESYQLQSGATGYSILRGRLTRPLLLLELLVVLVMLLTCVNLANLVLADATARERELAVRRAVGASRGRIVRQLFTESLVLSVTATVLSLVTAYWMSAALLSFLSPEQAPALVQLRFDITSGRVLAFAGLLSLLTCTLFGLVPAWRASRRDPLHALPMGAGNTQRNRGWMSRGLVICEVAMCTVLLMVAGLFVRTVQNLRWQNTGYQEDRLIIADVTFPRIYSEEQRDRIFEELRRRAAALPGVEDASFSHVGHLSGTGIEYKIQVAGNPETETMFEHRVSPGFLAAMGTRLVTGRGFTDADNEQAPLVGIVNEEFVRRFGLGEKPLGQRFIKTGGSRKIQTIEIVGVVADTKFINLRDDSPAMYYIPYRQNGGSPAVRFAIRSRGDLNRLGASVISVAKEIDPQTIITNVVPFSEIVNRTLMVERLVAQVSSAFGLLALMIAAVGLYGLLAYSIIRRRREIAVRIAVGAPPRSVERMILRESLGLLVAGFVIGVPAAILISRYLSAMLFGLGPEDPLTIAATLATLTFAAVMAACLPARRAAAIDPIVALREE